MYSDINNHVLSCGISSMPLWGWWIIGTLYFWGILIVAYIKSVIDETPIAGLRTSARASVLFVIWLFSPAVVLGFIWITFKVLIIGKR